MTSGLSYSEEALLNRVLFLSDTNEVNIFVEDEGKEYIYETIFDRLLNSDSKHIKINKIFPMMGKKGVIKAFRLYGEKTECIPNIYIVDGDFDILLKNFEVVNDHFIYLDRYNIESYLIEKDATIMYMKGKIKKRNSEVESLISYNCWENNVYENFKNLFIDYVVIQIKNPGEVNVGHKPYVFLDNDNGLVIQSKIQEYEHKLEVDIPDFYATKREILEKFSLEFNNDSKKLICGKYLLHSLCKYLKKLSGSHFSNEDFKWFLINNFNIETLKFLKDKILVLL